MYVCMHGPLFFYGCVCMYVYVRMYVYVYLQARREDVGFVDVAVEEKLVVAVKVTSQIFIASRLQL